MDEKTKIELMKIRSMASMVIDKIDKLIPEPEKKKSRSRLTIEKQTEILTHRKLIRMRIN